MNNIEKWYRNYTEKWYGNDREIQKNDIEKSYRAKILRNDTDKYYKEMVQRNDAEKNIKMIKKWRKCDGGEVIQRNIYVGIKEREQNWTWRNTRIQKGDCSRGMKYNTKYNTWRKRKEELGESVVWKIYSYVWW